MFSDFSWKEKIQFEVERINFHFISFAVVGQSDDPNCAKCDSRAVCIRLSNSTGVSCVCLPGFALSPSTGRCVLQGNRIFSSYVILFFEILINVKSAFDTMLTSVQQLHLTIITFISFSFFFFVFVLLIWNYLEKCSFFSFLFHCRNPAKWHLRQPLWML